MKSQFDIWDLDRSILEELPDKDIRSYLVSKYDIETADRIYNLLFPNKEETRET